MRRAAPAAYGFGRDTPPRRHRMTSPAIGTIVPSSNRTVERTLAGIMPFIPGVDSCIARITYYGPGIGQPKDGYDAETYRHAAWQLGHAKVGVVCWNGTRGAGLGLAADRALCATMAEAAGCPATTAALATVTLLDRLGATRIGVVTPGDVAQAAEAAAGLGRTLSGVRTLGLTDNHAAALVPPERIAALAREVAAEARPDAILLWSTNLPGWPVMAPLEAELGIPVIDSAAVGVWGCLDALGLDMTPAAGLGRIFRVA
jgi:maleate isomerase